MKRFVFRRQAVCFCFRASRFSFAVSRRRILEILVRSSTVFFSFPIFGSSGSTARGAHYRGGPDGVNNFVAVFLPDLHEGKLPLADLAHNITTFGQDHTPIIQTLPIQPHGTLFDHPDTLGGAGD